MVWDDVHGPGWEGVVWERGARSGMGMHGLGRCAWSGLGGHGPARIGKRSLGWGCTVWEDVHGPG